MRNALNLTTGHDAETARAIALTVPGMAHFAATGPFGATCGECALYGYQRKSVDKDGEVRVTLRRGACGKFFALTGRHGPGIPARTEACRYFVQRHDK